MRKIYWIGLFLFFLCSGLADASDGELVVIVSPENKVERISVEEMKAIYLKEKKEWEDGIPFIPIDLEESHPAREQFAEKIMKRTLAGLKFYWIQQIFSGRGTPPIVLGSEEKVKAYVNGHPGAIGYIYSKNLDATVKPIWIEGIKGSKR